MGASFNAGRSAKNAIGPNRTGAAIVRGAEQEDRGMPLERPKSAGLRDAAELAESADVAPQSVYNAMKNAWVPYKQVGRLKKLTQQAFAYHSRFGWAPASRDTAPRRRRV